MKLLQVTASVGYTVNIGQFNSLRFDASATVELEEGDNRETAYKAAFAAAKEAATKAATSQMDSIQASRDAVYSHVLAHYEGNK